MSSRVHHCRYLSRHEIFTWELYIYLVCLLQRFCDLLLCSRVDKIKGLDNEAKKKDAAVFDWPSVQLAAPMMIFFSLYSVLPHKVNLFFLERQQNTQTINSMRCIITSCPLGIAICDICCTSSYDCCRAWLSEIVNILCLCFDRLKPSNFSLRTVGTELWAGQGEMLHVSAIFLHMFLVIHYFYQYYSGICLQFDDQPNVAHVRNAFTLINYNAEQYSFACCICNGILL